MSVIQNIAVETYIQNLNFLKEHDISLFQRVTALTEYIEEDEEFDIFGKFILIDY